MRRELLTSLVLLSTSQFAPINSSNLPDKENWPRPAVMSAPIYPSLALARRIEATVTVSVLIDVHGVVAKAAAVEGPCRYSSPAPKSESAACDYVQAAEAQLRFAEESFKKSLDQSLSEADQKANFKAFDTEQWLAGQYQVYAAAEKAALQWQFESRLPPRSVGYHAINLTFRFSVGQEASIQVVDPWTIAVFCARYPAVQE